MIDLTIIWQFFSMFGDVQYWIGLVVGAILIYIVLRKSGKRRMAWVVFALVPAIIVAFQLSYVLKLWFQVPRPCVDLADCPITYSFPSSHAAVLFAFAVVTSLNIKKRLVWILVVVLAVLVSYSRVALNYHTPVDVLAGSLVGIFSGLIIQKMYKSFPNFENEKSSKRKSTKSRLRRFLRL
jgi:undecaprenyl-diphosphatase